MNGRLDRRRFLLSTTTTLAGMLLSGVGCVRQAFQKKERPGKTAPKYFPLIEVSGSPYEIGQAIGKRFGDQIRQSLKRRKEWFHTLRNFMEQDLPVRYEAFLAASKKHFPNGVAELQGWADGSGLPFKDLMALNLKAELQAMMNAKDPVPFGCSTLALSLGDRLLLAHNEDGDRAYADLMFMVKASQPGKPTFLCLTYPGILSGNGPAMNNAGIVLTTNFIAGKQVRSGVPRYFLSRAVLDAKNLKEAVQIATHPHRAFSFHYNLGSRAEKKILSVETSPDRYQTHEVQGLYLHTNHLVLQGMKAIPQDPDYVATSSLPRYRVLSTEAKNLQHEWNKLDGTTLIRMLSSHQRAPYSPCRHPTQLVPGATLANSLFHLPGGTWRLAFGNPCKNRFRIQRIDVARTSAAPGSVQT